MHDVSQSAFAQPPDEMQMVRHHDRDVDDKSICGMQPANRIKYQQCAILSGEDSTSTGDRCGQEVTTAGLGVTPFAQIDGVWFQRGSRLEAAPTGGFRNDIAAS